MPTIGSSYLTLVDWARRQKYGGGIDDIIEQLSQSNPVLQDAAVIEGNLPTGHRTTVRTGLPTVAWRLLNYGVATSKSTTAQVDDQCGMLEGYSRVDVDLAKLNGNEAAFRASEDDAFIQAMNNEVSTTIFYGDTALNPEKFLGLSSRFSLTTAPNGGNIINAGGSTASSQSSIWLVTWGPTTCHLIFPKASQAGLSSEDLGKDTITDANGGLYQAYVTHFQWKLGLTLRDWRYVVRIANIESALLVDDAVSGADLIRKCISAYYKRPTVDLGNMGKAVWYVNKTLAEYFHTQAMNKPNVNLQLSQVDGEMRTMLLGAPVRVCDSLTNTEAVVS